MSEFIHTEVRGHVLLLQITYEATLNCLNRDIMLEMSDVIRSYQRNPDLRALIITGSGRAFCTGADLTAFTNLTPEECVSWCMDFEDDIFHMLSSCSKPTIAAINGYAMGGGMELAIACDFRIGVEKLLLSAPEYNFGWVPGWGGVHRLGQLVGAAKAKEILLFKQKIRGQQALDLGLITELAAPEALIDRAFAMGEQLAELNPLTVTYTKVILDRFNVPPHDAMMQGLTNGITSKSAYAAQRVEEFFNRKK